MCSPVCAKLFINLRIDNGDIRVKGLRFTHFCKLLGDHVHATSSLPMHQMKDEFLGFLVINIYYMNFYTEMSE